MKKRTKTGFLTVLISLIIISVLIIGGYFSTRQSFFVAPVTPLWDSDALITDFQRIVVSTGETLTYSLGYANYTTYAQSGIRVVEKSKYWVATPGYNRNPTGTCGQISSLSVIGPSVYALSGTDKNIRLTSPCDPACCTSGDKVVLQPNIKNKYFRTDFNAPFNGGRPYYFEIVSSNGKSFRFGTLNSPSSGSIEFYPSTTEPKLQIKFMGSEVAGSPIDISDWNDMYLTVTTFGSYLYFSDTSVEDLFPCEAGPTEDIMVALVNSGNTITKEILPENSRITGYCIRIGSFLFTQKSDGTFGVDTAPEIYTYILNGQGYYLNNTPGSKQVDLLFYKVDNTDKKLAQCDSTSEVYNNETKSCEPFWNIIMTALGGKVDLVSNQISISTGEPICKDSKANLEKVPILSNGECPITIAGEYTKVASDSLFCYACTLILDPNTKCLDGTINITEGTCDAFISTTYKCSDPNAIENFTSTTKECYTLTTINNIVSSTYECSDPTATKIIIDEDTVECKIIKQPIVETSPCPANTTLVYQDADITKCSKTPLQMCDELEGVWNGTSCVEVRKIVETQTEYITNYQVENTPQAQAEQTIIEKSVITKEIPSWIYYVIALFGISIIGLVTYLIATRKKRKH